ncbi:MAG TPA: hypothetical protein VMF56_04820 [Acidobacteriaceae bacterium]|nr:hypothetical protein [Acidobacteriaceae bacterium]
MSEQRCKTRDLTRGWSALLLWGLPVGAIIVGSNWQTVRPLLWIPALLVMGAACVANAARCGRRHCYVTGPVCLLAAAYVALSAFHLVRLHPAILLDVVLGLSVLAFLSEVPLGRYGKSVENK